MTLNRWMATIALATLLMAAPAAAAPVLLDFEDLTDLEGVTTQYAAFGVTFTNSTVLTSGLVGGTLNEFDFPPFSGVNVVSDDGPITLSFGPQIISSFSAQFTYAVQLTLLGFRNGVQVTSGTSAGTDNLGLNEKISLVGLLDEIQITGDPFFGGSFTMDDLRFETVDSPPVPEPGTLGLMLLGGASLVRRRLRRKNVVRSS